jgi:Domain of unknown function (DUF4202)
MNPAALGAARAAIDTAHAADPAGTELGYADRCEAWVARLRGATCTELDRLAARCQHLERWAIPRTDFPADRPGYLRWRRAVHARQGQRAEQLLRDAGIALDDAQRVGRAVAKQGLDPAGDGLAQALEDAGCLVFLDEQLAAFAAAHGDYSEDKWLGILRKTWAKMSPAAQELARGLDYPPPLAVLLGKALS